MLTFESLCQKEEKIAVVGLGYVGLPLAVHLAGHFAVIGYDLKSERIKELENNYDRTLEVTEEDLARTDISFTDNPHDLSQCRLVIVAVPTPIDSYRIPNLYPLRSASAIVEKYSRMLCAAFTAVERQKTRDLMCE